MNSECLRIADQLRRAFAGDPWHGSPVRDLVAGVTAAQSQAHPLTSAHSIWELVLHMDIYVHAALEATRGVPMPKLYGTTIEWPTPADTSTAAWTRATDHLFNAAEDLSRAIDGFADEDFMTRYQAASTTSTISFTALCSTACITADRLRC
jgi:hypothetical protein